MSLTSKQKGIAVAVIAFVGVTAIILVMVFGGASSSEEIDDKEDGTKDEEGGTNDELCEGGLMDECGRGVGTGAYLSESCGRRFIKDDRSSTGYFQCEWQGAPRNSCDLWAPEEDVQSAKECEAPQTNGKPTCAHGAREGNGRSWQESTPIPSSSDQCSSTCCCPSGSTMVIHEDGNKWRCS